LVVGFICYLHIYMPNLLKMAFALSDFISDLGRMQTGDGICKRKSCGSTSDDGRSKRTRKTTKGDGFEQDTGASQRRIHEADTDNLSEDGGSKELKPDEDGSDSGTEDYFLL
jgi:hypothetical protein